MSACKADKFSQKFKYYKANKPKPSLEQVLSVDCCSTMVTHLIAENLEDDRAQFLGLNSLNEWKLYSFRDHPGLFIIRNPFTSSGQRYWIRKCLEEYPLKPNKTNIDIEVYLEDWWAKCFESGHCNRQLQKKLRWTTLGYHHDWDSKKYSDSNKTAFPEDLAELADIVSNYLGYKNFKAQAAIVNYYHMDSTLSPHTDHSEVNLEAPLFSFSFGQSAIFLIGGKDKNCEPSAILLNSGDIVVMSKEARLCYHAVPKILTATSTPWNDCNDQNIFLRSATNTLKYVRNPERIVSIMQKDVDNSDWTRFSAYLKESRINMNVRQVLNKRQKCLLTDFNES